MKAGLHYVKAFVFFGAAVVLIASSVAIDRLTRKRDKKYD